MPYTHHAQAEVEIDEQVVISAISSGDGMSIGSIAVAALNSWTDADIRALADESTDEEIRSIEILLRAMKGENPWPVDQS